MARESVLIVGAGPTGMTAAIECKRLGLDVRIVDKSDHMAQWSQALVVQARTLEQFQRYGIAAEEVNRGRKLLGGRLWSDGKQIAGFRLDTVPSRYPYALFIPQRETEKILNEHMESLGAKTERQVELTAVKEADGAVQARLRHADGSEEDVQPGWLLGCDGAHSTVRKQMGIPFEGKAIELNFILGDMELDGPDAPGDEIEVHFHRGDLVFLARIDDRVTRLIVGRHGTVDEYKGRDLTIQDFQTLVDRAGVRLKIRASDWMTPFSVNDRQAGQYQAGRIFLAGDASHIHSPVGGQGMNTGIQDVANLVWKLKAVERGADPALLNSYGEERAAVGSRLLNFTERVLKIGTTPERWAEAVRDVLMPLVTRLDAVQKEASGFISQTDFGYRDSTAVVDAGGDGTLRAGDRMPDVTVGGNEGLLAEWREPEHLMVLVNGATADDGKGRADALRDLPRREVRREGLRDEARGQLGSEAKLLLVRPDGYIGYRGPVQGGALAEYLRRVGLGQ